MKEVKIDTYQPQVYSSLSNFAEVQPHATKLLSSVKKLGSILIRHQMNEYFGICLLHKHFQMNETEKLIETVASDAARISPIPNIDEYSITAYMWKLQETKSEKYIWRPLEFVKNTSITSDQKDFVDQMQSNQAFLLEISEAVYSLGIQETFGLSLIHRQKIEVDNAHQVLLETENHNDRTLTIKAMSKEQPEANEWTETFWQFDRSGNILACTCCVCNP